MAGPKITIIGAGSYFFGRRIIRKMATSPLLNGGTLALVDTNPQVLTTMMKIARQAFDHTKCQTKLIGSTNRKEILADSDFVILTFSNKNVYYRKLDTEIAKQHGIRMCSSDTIGPGGIFRSLRELPTAIEIAKEMKDLAPNAWLVNYVNPATVIGMGLMRFAPEIKSFTLCDGHREPDNTLRWCKKVGILSPESEKMPAEVLQKLVLKIAGVNHCTWLTEFSYEGHNMLPKLRKVLEEKKKEEFEKNSNDAKWRYNYHYATTLFDIYGAYPTVVSHTKEYVPFFQGYGIHSVQPEPLGFFDSSSRAKEMSASKKRNEQYASNELSMQHFLEHVDEDHATDIIEAMWGKLKKSFYINVPNQGAVTNLAADAFLELNCQVSMESIKPKPFGPMPRGLLALQQQILDTHELTAEAAMSGDRSLLRRAMLTDPICNNIADTDACIQTLLAAEQEALPSYWSNDKSLSFSLNYPLPANTV